MSESDRELLEHAAKAAGYFEIDGWSVETHKGMRWVNDDRVFIRYWNPLTDDGDALRLAVKMKLLVDTDYNGGAAAGSADLSCDDFIERGQDPYAATRRAIVRAAAEIGRSIN